MIKKALQGRWLGHPLHPAIVHFPIALFMLNLVLDVASWIAPDRTLVVASTWVLALGVAMAVLAAIPGFADFASIRADHPGYTTAVQHLLLNFVAVVLYAVNVAIRWNGDDPTIERVGAMTAFLSIFGVTIISYSGYLGGKLVYDKGIGVGRHRRRADLPDATLSAAKQEDGWFDVAPDNLGEGQTLRAQVDGVVVTIVRHQDELFAVQEFCTHRFGPLSEGTCTGGKLTCPWHRSQFDLRTGRPTDGPAKEPLKTFEVAAREGRIRIKIPAKD